MLRKKYLQLNLGETSIRYKFYTDHSSRNRGANGLNILLSNKWSTINYTDIKEVKVAANFITGQKIILNTIFWGGIELALLTNTNSELEEIAQKIRLKVGQQNNLYQVV